jgi:hypothetical protein
MPTTIANYQDQRDSFISMLKPSSDKRLLFFRGESGMGKSTLISACVEEIPASILYVDINFKENPIPLPGIFSKIGLRIRPERKQSYMEYLKNISRAQNAQVDHNYLLGINQKLNVYQTENSPDQDEGYVALTEALFYDLSIVKPLLVISLDTYEDAPTAVKNWICGPFLYHAVEENKLRVLISGRKVPDTHEHNREWGHCCAVHELSGIRDPEQWLPVIIALNKIIPSGKREPLSYLAGICDALKGRPDEIMKMIEGFPQRESTL